MPYEIAFTRLVPIADPDQYINPCCVGGDVVVDALLPAVRARYDDIQTNQEDWGWFIWFKQGKVKLAIDVHTDDGEAGEFRIRLTSQIKSWITYKEVDTPELEELREFVERELAAWSALKIVVSKD